MSTPVVEMKILIPRRVYDKLEAIEGKVGIRKEDLVLKALVDLINKYGG